MGNLWAAACLIPQDTIQGLPEFMKCTFNKPVISVSLKGFNVYEWTNEGFSVETAATEGCCQIFR
jgi:hypothetical protein